MADVPLSLVVRRLLTKSLSGLQGMVETLRTAGTSNDLAKKEALLDFLDRTRNQFVRALVLLHWGGMVKSIAKAQEANALLSSQDSLIVSCADRLFYAAQSLQGARAAVYDVETAVDVLGWASSEVLLKRLPAEISALASAKAMGEEEAREALASVERALRLRLFTARVPLEFDSVRIESGQLVLRTSGEFEVSLTLEGDGEEDPWRLVWLDVLVEGMEASSRGGGEEAWVVRLRDSLQERLRESQFPLVFLQRALHSLCLDLRLEIAKADMASLREVHSPGAVRYVESLSRVHYWCRGKWREADDSEQQSLTPTQKDDTMISADCPYLEVKVDEYGELLLKHFPPLLDPETSSEVQFQLQGPGSLRRELTRAMRLSMLAKLYALRKQIMDASSRLLTVYSAPSKRVPTIRNLPTADPSLDIPLLGESWAYIFIDRGTGEPVLETSVVPQPGIVERFRRDKGAIVELVSNLLHKSASEFFVRLGETSSEQFHVLPVDQGVTYRILPFSSFPPQTSAIPQFFAAIDEQLAVSFFVSPCVVPGRPTLSATGSQMMSPPTAHATISVARVELGFREGQMKQVAQRFRDCMNFYTRTHSKTACARHLERFRPDVAVESIRIGSQRPSSPPSQPVSFPSTGEFTFDNEGGVRATLSSDGIVERLSPGNGDDVGYTRLWVERGSSPSIFLRASRTTLDTLALEFSAIRTLDSLAQEVTKSGTFTVLSKSLMSLAIAETSAVAASGPASPASVMCVRSWKDLASVKLCPRQIPLSAQLEAILTCRPHTKSASATLQDVSWAWRNVVPPLTKIMDWLDPSSNRSILPGDFDILFHRSEVFRLIYRQVCGVEITVLDANRLAICDACSKAVQAPHARSLFSLSASVSKVLGASLLQEGSGPVVAMVFAKDIGETLKMVHRQMAQDSLSRAACMWLEQEVQAPAARTEQPQIRFTCDSTIRSLTLPDLTFQVMPVAGRESMLPVGADLGQVAERLRHALAVKVNVEPWRVPPIASFARLLGLPTALLWELSTVLFIESLLHGKAASGLCSFELCFLDPTHYGAVTLKHEAQNGCLFVLFTFWAVSRPETRLCAALRYAYAQSSPSLALIKRPGMTPQQEDAANRILSICSAAMTLQPGKGRLQHLVETVVSSPEVSQILLSLS